MPVNGRVPIILMTAHGTADLAIEAIKWGAYDYLLKPFEMPDLLAMIAEAVAHNRSQRTILLKSAINEAPPSALVGNSAVMQTVYKEIGRVAATPAAVLIQGESGTGKELVARAIWQYSDAGDETVRRSQLHGDTRDAD